MSIQGLHSAYSGLRAAQAGMETTSHNIANVNTKGYTRQRIEQSSLLGRDVGYGYVGMGADIDSVIRTRQSFLDDYARSTLSGLGFDETRADLLQGLETIFGELDGGVTSDLTDVFTAFEDLSLHPDSTPARRVVLERLEGFTARLRDVGATLRQTGLLRGQEFTTAVNDVNQMLDQVAELNRNIVEAGANPPNDLMDQRDMLVDELSRKLGVRVIPYDNGSIRVSLNGLSLVDGTFVNHLTAASDGTLTHPSGAQVTVSGEVGGLQQFLTTDLPDLQTSLDDFAVGLVDEMNARHNAGFRDDGSAGGDLLAATGISDIRVLVTDPTDLAVAGSLGPGGVPAGFDGENAANLAALRSDELAPDNLTLQERFRDVVTGFGTAVAEAVRASDSSRGLFTAADLGRESFHGVNLDEEMVTLVQYQRSLEASSRVLSAIDEALNVLVNRTGIVGR